MNEITTDRPPNVVLMNCDDLGYGDIGCYGSALHQTPHLDRLAGEGMLFSDFYMASPVCSPSRAALLTGCYPARIGFGQFDGLPVLFPGHRYGLAPEEVTIADLLSAAGYATKLVGKWHCGDQQAFLPTRHGFTAYYGLPYSNDMGRQRLPEGSPSVAELLARLGIELPVDEMPPLPLLHGEEVIEAQPDLASLTERFVEESIRFMRANAERPFFLYLAHIYVHLPLYVQDRFIQESINGRYGAAVAAIDWAAGCLLAELERLGLVDDTIVIFTSDNGSRANGEGGSNLPLRGVKGSTWEGGMRVPFLARWPERIPAGTVSDAMVTAMDLLPTLAAIAGARVSEERTIDGRDISPVLLGEDGASPHEAFFYYSMDSLEAVRSGQWKLHLARRGEPVDELYDLASDIGETTNLFDAHPEVVGRLSAHAERARGELGDARLGIVGADTRPVGRVDHPVTLTTFDPEHPYYVAEYDLPDRG
ncbi:MAG: sulfatase family protein [Acidimicrobiales bacterium]